MKFTSPKNTRSQIAVIITFVIAVIFLFIAVFINLAKVSQVKTTTSTAADRAALSLASQLGSVSNYYKDKVLKISGSCATPPCQVCNTDLVSLGVLVGIVAAIGLMIIPTMGASLIALPLAIVISTSMLSAISGKYKEMTGYNAFRESALYQAVASIQSDDVELKAKTPGSGIFYEDANNNGVFDAAAEPVYNLSTIPEMRNEKKVSRFAAWYYALRLPSVDDGDMKNSLENIFLSRLKSFIDADDWDSGKWKINELSYVIEPGGTRGVYDITCSGSSCPDWVKDAATEQLRMVRMDASDNVSGGFLKDKLISLLNRLQDKYDETFCEETDCKIKPSEVNILIDQDLKTFLLRTKQVLNMPVSERFSYLTQWFPLWYYPAKHNYDRTSIDGNYDYDIYLRLTRDQNYINTWIAKLETLNNAIIKPGIIDKHGTYCEEGRPDTDVADTCSTDIASCYCKRLRCFGKFGCWWVCNGNKCLPPVPARWYGNYGTCTGNGFDHTAHPVCSNGDLYEAPPSYLGSNWCNNLRHVSCKSNNDSCSTCSIPPTNALMDNSYYFQGQMSWENTSGPTEVEQALKILRALDHNITIIKMSIAAFADKVEAYLPAAGEPYIDANNNGVYDSGETFYDIDDNREYTPLLPEAAKRNVIVYAWKDKPKPDGSQQFSHFAQVQIDGYPKSLPNITESIEWGVIPQKCRALNNYQGDFMITTWRYDQDQPTDIGKTDAEGWQFRRRKPTLTEFDSAKLNAIVKDIQDNGTIDTTQADVDSILKDYAIKSTSKAHYGPLKSDIYITGTKM